MSNNEIITETFTIPAGALEAAQAKLAKLGKKAVKIGLEAPTLKVVREFIEKVDDEDVLFADIEVTYQMIVVAGGWSFIASLETVDEVNGEPRNKVSGPYLTNEDHAAYATQKQICEHCHHNRKRNKTFIVKSAAGETLQIGSTCLKQFLGIDPTSVIKSYGFADLIDEMFGDLEGAGGAKYHKPIWSLNKVGPVIVSILSHEGFVSAGQSAYSGGMKTADSVVQFLNPPSSALMYADFKAWLEEIEPTDQHIKQFEVVRERLEGRILDAYRNDPSALDSFSFKLGIILNREAAEYNDLQILSAAINRECSSIAKEKIEANKPKKLDEFYPCSVGDKIEVEVAIEMVRQVDSFYGSSLLVKMLDDDGHSFSSFYSGSNEEFVPGSKVLLKGTVKKLQDDPKWGKAVILNRIKVLKTLEEAQVA